MTDGTEKAERSTQAEMLPGAKPTFLWQTTLNRLTDTVKLVMPPNNVVPIVFVPGIMGSNIMNKVGEPIWLLNKGVAGQPSGLAWMYYRKTAGFRQKALHPARTTVYRNGNVPKEIAGTIRDHADYIARGWGEVGEASYHDFLVWLEKKLNGASLNPAEWPDFSYTSVSATARAGEPKAVPKLFPGIPMEMRGVPTTAESGHVIEAVMSDELLKRAKCRFPVHAFGYNWLESNERAAERLRDRVNEVIAKYNHGAIHCSQVIIVTHSMGGLVSRACTLLEGMTEKIAGIVHGVMPATGAAVAYRRCKVGMGDEDAIAAVVIGDDGRQVTAVFAQAPGALQLLPSQTYRLGWLKIKDEKGNTIESLPKVDPYAEIYLCKDKWWGLVDGRWLSPEDGTPIKWREFSTNIKLARDFHEKIKHAYHENSYVYYGAGDKKEASFETIEWRMRRGTTPKDGARPTVKDVVGKNHDELRELGENKLYVGGETVFMPSAGYMAPPTTYETSFWEIVCGFQDGLGDGTVPSSSGAAPRGAGGKSIRQQFRLSGFTHEGSYKNSVAQNVTHYAITKIMAQAKIS